MKKLIAVLLLLLFIKSSYAQQYPSGIEILKEIDKNLVLDKAVSRISMIIHGRAGTRTVKSTNWVEGKDKAFVEYTDPAREAGKKMLKLGQQIWIYVPEPTDRIITISGHLLRQSVMGSDLSYEDITENRKLNDIYNAKVTGSENVNGRSCWIVELTAKLEDVTYASRKLWVDKERGIPLKEERYAKSGRALKKSQVTEVFKIEDRWYPKKVLYFDLMQNGEGTKYIVESVKLNVEIPASKFTKASLKK